jgi:YD repeat-containing protein
MSANNKPYIYDNFDNLQTRTDEPGRRENHVFHQLGNLTTFTDRRGKVTTYHMTQSIGRKFAGSGLSDP